MLIYKFIFEIDPLTRSPTQFLKIKPLSTEHRTTLIDFILCCRREHLSPDDIQKNKAIMENLTKGNWNDCEVGALRHVVHD